jgi:hypothetical protein
VRLKSPVASDLALQSRIANRWAICFGFSPFRILCSTRRASVSRIGSPDSEHITSVVGPSMKYHASVTRPGSRSDAAPNPAATLQSYQVAYLSAVADANAQFNVASCGATDTFCQAVTAQERASVLSYPTFLYFNTLVSSATAEVSATPLPAALPLYATGLGALALLRWRKRRKGLAAA